MKNPATRLLAAAAVGTTVLTFTATSAGASPAVVRYQGPDRYATSAVTVDASYSPGVPVAYLATGTNFPDALAGGAAATNQGGPLLLVQPGAIPPVISSELQRLRPGRIVVLGGEKSVSPAVAAALASYTSGGVTRVSGADRYQTAAALAAGFPAGSPVYVATGANFPDALSATAAAAAQHAAILLTEPNTLPSATAQALSAIAPSSITIVGSTNAVSATVASQLNAYSTNVTRVAGADRYATAAAIANAAFPGATGVFVASGNGFADALTGGPVAGLHGQPLLLAASSCLPQPSASTVSSLNPASVTLLGGTATLTAGVAALTTCAPPPALAGNQLCGTKAAGTHYSHIIWIWMENKPYGSVIGNSSAPYENAIAHQCAMSTNYYGITHPSLPNYLAATGGSTFNVTDDASPASHPIDAPSLFSQLTAAGKSSRSYEESMPTNCATTSASPYAVKHNPAAYYTNIRAICATSDVPLDGNFDRDIAAGTLPAFSFVTPNLCNDMHDCSVATGDAWLAKWIPMIVSGPNYRAGDTMIVLTWDEGSGTSNQIPTVVVAPSARPGTVASTRLDHYALLGSTEDVLGVARLGAAVGAPSLVSAFGL
jgi:hypothetical protein